MDRHREQIKRAPRVSLRRATVLIDSEGRESKVLILDISGGGFRLEVDESPCIGEFVRLRVERSEELAGEIRWALGNEAGGVFLEGEGKRIDPEID